MKIYKQTSVLDEALERIRWCFDEFSQVAVAHSGGKDSTVVFELAMQVAKEKGRLPLPVMWIDQEAEWLMTEEFIRSVMYRDDVVPYWIQVPFGITSATSFQQSMFTCWEPGVEWVRDKDPIAYKENIFGPDKYLSKMFDATTKYFFVEDCCVLGGVRTEESPGRQAGLINAPAYKWATWGRICEKKKKLVTMYPIYDWSYTDVWKAIHEHGWPYNRLYDIQYQRGASVLHMRVSSLVHATALWNLFALQDVEPEMYDKLAARLHGVNASARFGMKDFYPKDLPFMFNSWQEYRDFLLEKLITEPAAIERFRAMFANTDKIPHEAQREYYTKIHVAAILSNDWYGVKLENARASTGYIDKKAKKRSEAVG